MPNKIKTETQFARLIGATPLQVELTLVKITSHTPKNTSAEHMLAFYEDWEDVQDQKFDGFIVTGAPVELLDFEDVTYWDELSAIYDWTQTNVQSTFNICWGAQAALYHFHKVPKHALPKKAFGVYRHRNLSRHHLTCAASPTTFPFRCPAGPRTTAPTCRETRASRC